MSSEKRHGMCGSCGDHAFGPCENCGIDEIEYLRAQKAFLEGELRKLQFTNSACGDLDCSAARSAKSGMPIWQRPDAKECRACTEARAVGQAASAALRGVGSVKP